MAKVEIPLERARTLHHLRGDLYTSPGRRVRIESHRPVSW